MLLLIAVDMYVVEPMIRTKHIILSTSCCVFKELSGSHGNDINLESTVTRREKNCHTSA